jgi:hypothetical protein
MPQAIRYSFVQRFKVSDRKAYEWCTDYAPSDMALMREEIATREVRRISSDSVILVDTFVVGGKPVVKQKLVCLYPDRLTWTSTHLTGPNKYSQFLYEITSKTDEQSCLTFTALSLDSNVKSDEEAKELAKKLNRMDSETWKLLAKRMEEDFQRT